MDTFYLIPRNPWSTPQKDLSLSTTKHISFGKTSCPNVSCSLVQPVNFMVSSIKLWNTMNKLIKYVSPQLSPIPLQTNFYNAPDGTPWCEFCTGIARSLSPSEHKVSCDCDTELSSTILIDHQVQALLQLLPTSFTVTSLAYWLFYCLIIH